MLNGKIKSTGTKTGGAAISCVEDQIASTRLRPCRKKASTASPIGNCCKVAEQEAMRTHCEVANSAVVVSAGDKYPKAGACSLISSFVSGPFHPSCAVIRGIPLRADDQPARSGIPRMTAQRGSITQYLVTQDFFEWKGGDGVLLVSRIPIRIVMSE